MISRLELIKPSPYFTGLVVAELEAVSRLMSEKQYERGEIILFEGEEAGALYFIASGAAKIFKTSVDGKEQILTIVRPGEAFNEVPVFNGGINPANAQAMTPVTLYGISRKDIEAILHSYPQVALNVIKVMAKRLRHMVLLVEDLSFRRVIGRVARILLEYVTDGTAPGAKLTQRDMAAIAGTAREVVSRSLKSLEDKGIIRMDRHRIIVKDKAALREMVDSSV